MRFVLTLLLAGILGVVAHEWFHSFGYVDPTIRVLPSDDPGTLVQISGQVTGSAFFRSELVAYAIQIVVTSFVTAMGVYMIILSETATKRRNWARLPKGKW